MRRTASVTTLLVAAAVAVLWPGTARAQHGHGRGHATVFVGGGYFYDPFLWDPFWYPYYGYGLYPPYPYYYPYGPYADDASIRLEVKPKEAQVYVDGYFAGIVDDYDGIFQRLHVEPGDHDLVLYLEGYKSVREHLAVARNGSYKVKYTMEKLAPGEPNEPKPVPIQPPPGAMQAPPQRPQPPMYGPPRPPRQGPPPAPGGPPPPEPPAASARGYGVLAIRVQPSDAEILIDGESWRGPEGEERLLVQLAEGPHHVEIRKEGRRTFSTDVTVRGGETLPLNVSLSPGDQR